jgi:hypothetical protein
MHPIPRDPAAALASCERELFDELATTCRVQAAAAAAAHADVDLAERACAGITDARWSEECQFRVAEELGRRGLVHDALAHCVRAGQYSRWCLTHVGWFMPPDPALRSDGGPPVLIALDAFRAKIPKELPDAERVLLARWWFNLYYGTGVADAAPATADGGPDARLALALEVVRLRGAGPTSPQDVSDVASGLVVRGAPLEPHHRHGRYHPRLDPGVPGTAAELYGGGERIVAADTDVDRLVTAMEGLYFQPDVDGSIFVQWLDHPAEEVRWTATRRIRTTPSRDLDHEAVLNRMAGDSSAAVAAEARAGLVHREWLVFTGGPGPR